MITARPRRRAVCAYCMTAFGERCAETTCTSYGISKLASRSAALSIVSQSLSLPMRMPTCGRPSRTAMLPVLSLRRQRAMADVAPEVHPRPADLVDGGVRLGHRPVDRVAECRDAEHAATVGDQTAVVDPRTRVEDHAVGPAREALEPVDRPAALDGTRVPLRGEHDAHRRARVPLERLAGEPPLARAREEVEQIGAESYEENLRLGVAEADVELEDLRAPVLHHETGVQHARVRRALLRERLDDGSDDLLHDLGLERRRDDGCRRVGAHAAGVRALVAVEDALVVLGRRERHDRRPVRERHERDLVALEELLDDHAAAGVAEEPSPHELVDRLLGLGDRAADEDALAAGEAVRLDDDGRTDLVRVAGR